VDSVPTWTFSSDSLFPTPTKKVERFSISERCIFKSPTLSEIYSVKCLDDQSSFVTIDSSSLKLWNIEYPNEPPYDLYVHEVGFAVTAAGVHPTGSGLFLIGDDIGNVKLFDIRSTGVTSVFGTPPFCKPECVDESISSVQFEPAGTMFAVRNFTHLQVWDVRRTENPHSVQQVQWAQDGGYVRGDNFCHDEFGSIFTKSGEIYSGLFGHSFVCWDWKRSVVINHRASKRMTKMADNPADLHRKVSPLVSNHAGSILGVVATAALYFYELI
jgi:hypothetical protein